MSLVLRAVLRALARAPGRALGVLALVAVSVTVYAGTFMGLDHIASTTDTLYQELHLFDLELRVAPGDRAGRPEVEDLPGVEGARWRLMLPATVELADGRLVGAVLMSLPSMGRPRVGDVQLTEGRWLDPTKPSGALVDATFASDAGLSPGVPFRLRVQHLVVDLSVQGVGVYPEYLMGSVDEHFFMPVRETLVVVGVSEDLLLRLLGFVPTNSLALTFEAGADPEATRAAVEDRVGKVQSALWAQDQFSVWCNWNRLAGFRDFLPSVIGLFTGLSFLVLLLLVRRVALGWRRELGALLASGVLPGEVLGAWALALGALVTAGAAFGGLGGAQVGRMVSEAYVQDTGFPILLAEPSWGPLLQAWGVSLIVVAPAILLPLWPLLREAPAALLREVPPEARSDRVHGLFGKLEPVLSRVPTPERLGLRNLLRRPALSLTSTVCLSGMLVTAASMYIFADGLDAGLEDFLATQRWDAVATLTQPMDRASLQSLLERAEVEHWEPMRVRPARLEASGGQRSMELVGLSLPSALSGDGGLVRGRFPGTSNAAEVVVSLRVALQLGLALGDVVQLDAGQGSRSVEVVGVVNNYVVNRLIVGEQFAEALTGSSSWEAVMLQGGASAQTALGRRPEVALVLPGDRVRRSGVAVNSVLTGFLRFYGHLAAGVGALLLWVLLGVARGERVVEDATLRAFGLGEVFVVRARLAEVLGVTAVAVVAAVPATWAAVRVFQGRIQEISVFVPVEMGAGVFIGAAGGMALVGVVSALVPRR